jgi:cytosine/adenosine deaminase-related metal-dependent hydrolase
LNRKCLAVHANYLGRDDAKRLAQGQTSVVHCPRSHAYFRHQSFPHAALARAGVNLCLGTDSLATVAKQEDKPLELSLFAEMRALAANCPGLPPKVILQMATRNGASALGLQGRIGELVPNAWADLIAVPCGEAIAVVHEAIVHHTGPVAALMIGGKWVTEP